MCGICGFIAPRGRPIDAEAGRRMRETLVHRGPDGDGEAEIASNGGPLHGWFGHRRLKILDLTEHAHQPMRGSDGKTHLTYNGEIYNFRDLRRELQAAGMAFHSTGDTKVVLRAYEHWGLRA